MANEKTWAEMDYDEKMKIADELKKSAMVRLTTTGGDWTMGQIPSNTPKYVPYQICPKCNGQGMVSKPPYIAGDVYEWSSSDASFACNVCNGAKIIPMHHIQEPVSCPHVYSPDDNNHPLANFEWLVLKTEVTGFEGDSVEYTNLIAKFKFADSLLAHKFMLEQTKGQYCLRVIVVLGISFE